MIGSQAMTRDYTSNHESHPHGKTARVGRSANKSILFEKNLLLTAAVTIMKYLGPAESHIFFLLSMCELSERIVSEIQLVNKV